MALYTVLVHFSDHTNGIEQIEAVSPHEAINVFVGSAKCLAEYPRVDRLVDRDKGPALIHVADGLRGFWIWVIAEPFDDEEDDDLEAVLGGYVVQTDRLAPLRNESV